MYHTGTSTVDMEVVKTKAYLMRNSYVGMAFLSWVKTILYVIWTIFMCRLVNYLVHFFVGICCRIQNSFLHKFHMSNVQKIIFEACFSTYTLYIGPYFFLEIVYWCIVHYHHRYFVEKYSSQSFKAFYGKRYIFQKRYLEYEFKIKLIYCKIKVIRLNFNFISVKWASILKQKKLANLCS